MYSELLIFLPIFFPFHIFFILFSRGSYSDYTPLYLSYLFMTGLDAGLVYNSFPKFADRNNVQYLHYGFEIDLCPLDYNQFSVIE